VVRLDLPPVSARTLYDQWGDYVPWTAVVIAALAAVIALVRADRRRISRYRPAGLPWDGNPERDRSGAAAGTARDGTARDGTATSGSALSDGSPAGAPPSEQ
jgi:hypothetical protein